MPAKIDLLPFSDNDPGVALYLQIAKWIEQNITEGKIAPRAKLPTVRALAAHLDLNRGAIAAAYAYLTKEGTLTARVGKGTFVQAQPGRHERNADNPRTQFWEPILAKIAGRIGPSNYTLANVAPNSIWVPDRGEVSGDQLHLPLNMPLADHALSYQLIQQAILDMAGRLDKRTLSYSHPQGTHGLRECIAGLAAASDIEISPNDVLITNGAQQALSLITALLVQPGDMVITENPTYPGAIRAFRFAGANLMGVPLDSDGMRVDLLEGILQHHKPKLIYTIPSFHAPTGATLTAERRLQLYQLARRHNVPIVEDEYVSDLYYGAAPPKAIKSFDVDQLVIYIGTFSKTLGASMRVGWVAAHPGFIAQLVQIKEVQDIHSSIFSQLIVEYLLHKTLYQNLLIRLRHHYGDRYRALSTKIHDRLGLPLPPLRYTGGFSLWLEVPSQIPLRDWLAYTRIRGVPFEDGAPYYLGPEPGNHAKFSFSLLSMKDIDTAVDVLEETLRELSKNGAGRANGSGNFLPFG